jgi:putative transposase
MPRMNVIVERWVQTCRRELLDPTLIWNQAHLLYALREFEQFYNAHRRHQGIANARPLRPLPSPITGPGAAIRLHVHRHDRLGGILHEYRHAAYPARMRFRQAHVAERRLYATPLFPTQGQTSRPGVS